MRYVQVGNIKVACFSEAETKRWPNRHLGKHCRINVPQTLQEDKKLSKYVNNETMGALDNYAHHENLNIYISPLENDLFDNVSVGVYRTPHSDSNEKEISSSFTMKIQEGKDSFHNFMKELYTRVAGAVNGAKTPEK